MFCSQCGARIATGASHCARCQAPVKATGTTSTGRTAPGRGGSGASRGGVAAGGGSAASRGGIASYVSVAAVVFVLAVLAIGFYMDFQDKKASRARSREMDRAQAEVRQDVRKLDLDDANSLDARAYGGDFKACYEIGKRLRRQGQLEASAQYLLEAQRLGLAEGVSKAWMQELYREFDSWNQAVANAGYRVNVGEQRQKEMRKAAYELLMRMN